MSYARHAGFLTLAATLGIGCGRTITTASGQGGGVSTGGASSGNTTGVLSNTATTGTGSQSTGSQSTGSQSTGSQSTGSQSTGSQSTGSISSGSVMSSVASSTGAGMTCAGYGDNCTDCISASCSQVWCDCRNNPECVALYSCWQGCGTNQTCVNNCIMTHSSGVSQALLVDNCAGTTCAGSCTWGQPIPPCTQCIYSDCTQQMNACFADPECVPLLDCLDACPPSSVVCAQGCYNQHGAGTMALQPVIDCSNQKCQTQCT